MKEKLMRSVSSIALAFLLMLLLLPASVLASTSNQDVMPEGPYTLNIHKYANKQGEIPNRGDSPNGEVITVDPGFLPVEGIGFTIWKVKPDAEGVYPSDASKVDVTNASHVDISSEKTAQTNTSGNAVFNIAKGDQGVYLVKETDNSGKLQGESQEKSFAPIDAFLVQVPMTKVSGPEAGVGWLKDVHVYPKNQNVSIDKFVNASGAADHDFVVEKNAKSKPVAVSEVFGMTIESAIPWDIAESNWKYVITDVLGTGMVLKADTIKVYAIESATTPTANAAVLTKDIDYTLSVNGNQFKVALKNNSSKIKNNSYSMIRVKYDAYLDASAAQCESISGKATLNYSANASSTFSAFLNTTLSMGGGVNAAPEVASTVTTEPSVHTGQIRLMKYDAENKTTAIAGAEFGIALTKEDAQKGNFVAAGVSDANGEIIFAGLKYGQLGDSVNENSSNTTYWLVETKAPEGYEKLNEAVEVKFDYHQSAKDSEFYFAEVAAYNQKTKTPAPAPAPGDPPKTGDSNIIVYAAAGIMLLAVAVFLIALRSKNKLDKSEQKH